MTEGISRRSLLARAAALLIATPAVARSINQFNETAQVEPIEPLERYNGLGYVTAYDSHGEPIGLMDVEDAVRAVRDVMFVPAAMLAPARSIVLYPAPLPGREPVMLVAAKPSP